jgi:hypothetical protein
MIRGYSMDRDLLLDMQKAINRALFKRDVIIDRILLIRKQYKEGLRKSVRDTR